MATVTIMKSAVRDRLVRESTNVARTIKRNDGVSDFEEVLIDQQSQDTLLGAWHEACSKLEEKMHEFINYVSINDSSADFDFVNIARADAVEENILMYIVDYMMADWLASVRPDFRQRYIDRANFQLDDLLRKLYKKEPPV